MPWISEEQKKLAKEVDLLTYLQTSEPNELIKSGANEYRTATHSSLVISNGLWIWNREQIGGRSALDYLIKVRGMNFLEAIEMILNSPAVLSGDVYLSGPHSQANFSEEHNVSSALTVKKVTKPEEKKELFIPKATSVPHKVVKYLEQRGIHSDIIGQCLKSGIIYESVYRSKKDPALDGADTCVFIGRDSSGIIRFVAQRGINIDFKRDSVGSDKAFNFTLPAENPSSKALAVFEAPMDLLSHATLTHLGHKVFDGYRLSLGGTSDVALIAYLERNPHIEKVLLCLDNDEAGLKAVDKIITTLSSDERFKHITVSKDLPSVKGHDYNDELLQVLQNIKEHKPSGLFHVSERC